MAASIGGYILAGLFICCILLFIAGIVTVPIYLHYARKKAISELCSEVGIPFETWSPLNFLFRRIIKAEGDYHGRRVMIWSRPNTGDAGLGYSYLTAKLKQDSPNGLCLAPSGITLSFLKALGVGWGQERVETGDPLFDGKLALSTNNGQWAKSVLDEGLRSELLQLGFQYLLVSKGEAKIAISKMMFSKEFARKHLEALIRLADRVDSL